MGACVCMCATQEEQSKRRQAERDFLELMSSIEDGVSTVSGANATNTLASKRLAEMQVRQGCVHVCLAVRAVRPVTGPMHMCLAVRAVRVRQRWAYMISTLRCTLRC